MSAVNEETRALHATIDFGMQAEAFLLSPIGRYLVKRAEGEIEQAVEGLKQADPDDSKSIRNLQNAVKVAESIQYWLAEAIQTGHNAQVEFIESST